MDPEILEGWHALDAHLSANKLRLARELLDGPGGTPDGPPGGEFGYLPFRDSLRKMILDGVDGVDGDPSRKFYIGPPASAAPNGRAYGLVNVALFLAMSFEDSIHLLIERIGPIKPQILRFYVSRPVEELAEALRILESSGRVSKVVALQPDPTDYYASPKDAEKLLAPMKEDRSMRILSQSDPFCSRFIQEVRLVLRQG